MTLPLAGAAPEKALGLINGISLTAGLQIGSGIFASPGVVVANTGSVGASLSVWLLSGLLSWTGASSLAELGAALPFNGGVQAYLGRAYSPLASCMYTWTLILVLSPGSKAVISLVFAEYICRAVCGGAEVQSWTIQLVALAAIGAVTLLCACTHGLGSRAAVVFMAAKILAMVAVALCGVAQLLRGRASSSLTGNLFAGSSRSPHAYGRALCSGLWAFDGWDQVGFVGGEMQQPEKTIPRTLHGSMALVLVLFLLANLSYFVVLEKDAVGASNTIALDFGQAMFGAPGGALFALVVALSCFGALHASFFTDSRAVHAAGRTGILPARFGAVHPTRRTPVNALFLQAGTTGVFVLAGVGFRALVGFAVVTSWALYFLVVRVHMHLSYVLSGLGIWLVRRQVLGVMVLWVREPDLPRPYKTWTVTPVVFCMVALFVLSVPALTAPWQTLTVAACVGTGVSVYYVTLQRKLRLLDDISPRPTVQI
ncbi:amino acid transporter [Artomyces pyxidatus]|uniref:Amino acid transporter n=1 Tax=Artomyces pyxidatus TaxID=48021 RepID=A0ACB8STS4_9AGAM|nr:amino acid transporter [Artomyces pyxidatus]